jgi:hypothetical protein
MIPDMTSGAANRIASPAGAATLALEFHPAMLPSDALTMMPKMLRLQIQIQREPPRAPVNSYH